MRLWKLAVMAVAAVASAACGNAEAQDMTLTYKSNSSETDTLLIRSDGEGRVRIDDGRGQSIIIRDNQTYLVFPGPGRRDVARVDDFLAVGAEVREQMRRSGAYNPSEGRYSVREEGPQVVGRWQGVRYYIERAEGSGRSSDVVLSNDPALAEARPVAVTAFQARARVGNAVLPDPAEFTRLSDEVMLRGMPIGVEGLELQSISNEPVPVEQFELPGPVLTRDQLRQRRQN